MSISLRRVVTLLSALLTTSALAQEVPIAADESARAWLVELSSPPGVEGTSPATLRSEKAAFRAAARQAGVKLKERFAFDTLWNGISVDASRGQVAALQRLPGVKAVWPVERFSVPSTTEVANPDLVTALTMTGADIVQSALGLTGKGVKVAIIDTGIDYEHPDLGGCFGPGCRVAVGFDFVGDAYDAAAGTPPVPDPDPMDCAGHGTHVTGIVGANGAVTGVAPGVTFGAYRVFGCTGSTDGDVMIAAMERALADGMQVLNMSIGSAFTWPQYPTAVAANRLVNRGVVVVASIGNSGANGIWSAGAPGVGEKVIGVASFDNVQINGVNAFTVTPDGRHVGYLPGGATTGGGNPPAPPLSGSAELVRTGTTSTGNDACNGAPTKPAPGSLTGKIALIRRGTCAFAEKVQNAQNAGAVAVVLYNNVAGPLNAGVSNPAFTPTIPTAGISSTDGAALNTLLAAGTVTLGWTADLVNIPNPGNIVSSFSSYGLAPDLSLKPDIGAPGGFIRSTFPRALGSYANLSGTSMASPHVAGTAALFLELRPGTRSHEMRDILQNTASPRNWFGNPALGFLENVHRQGAGMVRIDAAVQATARATPGKLSLGESEAGPATRTITLTNAGASDVTLDVSTAPALATGPSTFTPSFFVAPATVTFSATSVTVPAGGSATVTATITAPADAALANRGLYGGFIVFTPADEAQALRVPFAGFKGDYQSIQVLTPTANGFPWLARAVGASFVKQVDGATFDLAAGDLPTVLVHLDHQARIVQMEVIEADTGRSFHRAFRDEFEVRSSTATGFFAIPWDGTTGIGAKNGFKVVTAPAGKYVLRLSVLKALGDESNPAHWETWTSPAFTITR